MKYRNVGIEEGRHCLSAVRNEGLPKINESRGRYLESVRSPGETSIILKTREHARHMHPTYAVEEQNPGKKEEGLGGRTNRRRRLEGMKD